MGSYAELQAEHQRLLAQRETGGDTPDMVKAAQAYIERARREAMWIASPRERDQVRANLRFWASYVFEQTGTYPDTTLRPAELPAAEPRPARTRAESAPAAPIGDVLVGREAGRRGIVWVIIGGLVLLGGVLCGVLSLGVLGSGGPPTSVELTATAQAVAQVTDTVEPTSMATPSATPTPTPIPKTPPPVLTSAIGPTVTPTRTPARTPTLTATSTPTRPATNGDEFERPLFLARMAAQDSCDARSVTVIFDGADLVDLGALTEMRLRLTESGTGTVVRELQIPPGQAQAEVDLSELRTQSPAIYLLHVDQSSNTFSDVILQWEAGCTGNQVTVTYIAQQAYSLLEEEPPRAPELPIDWWLVNWGPSPYGDTWIAVLALQAFGDSGQYIFWDGDEPLSSPQVLISGSACDYGQTVIGVTSNGRTYAREVVILSPHCPSP